MSTFFVIVVILVRVVLVKSGRSAQVDKLFKPYLSGFVKTAVMLMDALTRKFSPRSLSAVGLLRCFNRHTLASDSAHFLPQYRKGRKRARGRHSATRAPQNVCLSV